RAVARPAAGVREGLRAAGALPAAVAQGLAADAWPGRPRAAPRARGRGCGRAQDAGQV
ncbi:unnamed protein product, partial [Effrenium voratum]